MARSYETKMKSMKINDAWILVDLPEEVKPIACKWIFKRKGGADRKMQTYKVHLVVEDYHQR